jgi:hypothetical protein
MSDQMASKPMGMLLQDPTLRDDQGEYLHTDYDFALDQDFLVATGSSKYMVRDEDENGAPMFSSLDWADPGTGLAFQDFNQQPLERPLRDNPHFHQVNVFAVVAHTHRNFEKALGRELLWRNGTPLVIRPHAFGGANAYSTFDSWTHDASLNFGYFDSPFRPETVWMCLSHDVVAHELGHSIWDALRPLFAFSSDIDTPALNESFGDITALFSALEHPALVERLYKESGGDMSRPTFASRLAEEFGTGVYGAGTPYLRSALEGPPYDPFFPKEEHDRSTIWTAAIYDILRQVVATRVPYETRSDNFEEFKQAVVTATSLTRTMVIRALQYTAPTGITMPLMARLIYESDQRLYPDDPSTRDIAKRVFEQRNLWDQNIVLDAPGIGHAFEDFEAAGPAARVKMVVDHADALRIPLSLGPRILRPHLITARRQIDDRRTLTERYLHFAYELVDTSTDFFGNSVGVSIYKGGTLVMDEDFNDVALVTDPPTVAEDIQGDAPALQALTRATDRFHTANDRAIQAIQSGRVKFDSDTLYEGSAFKLIKADGAGPARLVKRRCNIVAHMRAINQRAQQHQFSIAKRLGRDEIRHHGLEHEDDSEVGVPDEGGDK